MKEINLKNQLTDELKNKWYYNDIKWGLTINKNSVVFDHDFKFKVKAHKDDNEPIWYTIDFYINDRYDKTIGCYEFNSRWSDNPAEMLENICLYIANCI